MTIQVNISPDGRMCLPAALRKRLGLTAGGAVFLEETEYGVVLRAAVQVVARAQALTKRFTGDKPEASVDAFLVARRADSGD